MIRHFALVAALAATLGICQRAAAAPRAELVPQPTAARHGLTRAWFTQVAMDAGQSRVRDIVLDHGTLVVQTDRAVIHAIDAETGQTLWAKQIGDPRYLSMTPGLSQDLVVVVNGTRLFAVNRSNGEVLYQTTVDGVPGAGAAVSRKIAYLPMIDGVVTGYRLRPLGEPSKEPAKAKSDATPDDKATTETRRDNQLLRQDYVPPLTCQSNGHVFVQPLITTQSETEDCVVWPTDRGNLELGQISHQKDNQLTIAYQLRTDAEIVARPAYAPPDPQIVADSGVVFVGSKDGFIYAIVERTGQTLWRFSAGEAIVESPALIDDRVYLTTQFGGMYCLAAKDGTERWWTRDILRFLAASKDRVYAADTLRRLQILDAKTGARLDTLPAAGLLRVVSNTETDRIYLATDTGLIQCLREVELTKPLVHNANRTPQPTAAQTATQEPPRAKKPPAAKPAAKQPAAEAAPAGDNPFAEGGGAADASAPAKPGGAKSGGAKAATPKPSPKPPLGKALGKKAAGKKGAKAGDATAPPAGGAGGGGDNPFGN